MPVESNSVNLFWFKLSLIYFQISGAMLFILITISLWTSLQAALTEFSGFHCMMRHSMRMNRAVHGKPQETSPPFEFRFLDAKGYETRYYEPGKIYTIRLIGFVHFRGLLLQGRLANENGFLLGSLKGGHFIENENWETFGIRMQDCDPRGSNWQDSVTHTDDSQKFIVQLEWTADKDIGAVQFMLTIAEEDEIYWERWRPESGFIIPISWKGKHLNPISDGTMAVKLSAKKRKPAEPLTNSHNKESLSIAENTENFTATEGKDSASQRTVYEKRVLHRDNTLNQLTENTSGRSPATKPVPETLRDLAYRHENEVEEDISEKISSTLVPFTAPLWKSESFTPTRQPMIRTTAPWQLRTEKLNEIEHVYESRFPKIFMRSLNNEPAKTKGKITSVIRMSKCVDNPCENGGRCRPDSDTEVGFICSCKEGWIGPLCETKDQCVSHSCVSGKCVSLKDSYQCACWKDYAGKCDPNLCKRNGTCVEKSNGELGCKCPPGASGRYCEREINECNFQRCKNGAKCIDKWNDYSCICPPGWMGKDCDRPCQDIYGSCNQWKQQGQCEQMRHHTRFFDVNCAVSCGQCTYSNETVTTTKPLAPILLPLAWMIGIWKAEVNGTRSRTVDYVTDFEGIAYTEILAITVADVLVFGKPSINFTSIAINRNDTTDQHVHYGFLTVGPNPNGKPLVALITASNLGQIMIEEGEIRSNSIQFTPTYRSILSHTVNSLPLELHRTFTRNDKRLVQSLTKKDVDGRNRSVNKRYDKIVDIEYL
uniref:Reelin n=1 Tax=Elaeophora elaphi TaxID=1147741 RepID=A0A0R3RU81_9BILA